MLRPVKDVVQLSQCRDRANKTTQGKITDKTGSFGLHYVSIAWHHPRHGPSITCTALYQLDLGLDVALDSPAVRADLVSLLDCVASLSALTNSRRTRKLTELLGVFSRKLARGERIEGHLELDSQLHGRKAKDQQYNKLQSRTDH
jgi:hypothetical protein